MSIPYKCQVDFKSEKEYEEFKKKNPDAMIGPAQTASYDSKEIDYRYFRIVTKKDFGSQGHLIDGFMCTTGFVVIHGPRHQYHGANAMPGATWFQTVDESKKAIDDLIASEGDADIFWRIHSARGEYEKKFDPYERAETYRKEKERAEAEKKRLAEIKRAEQEQQDTIASAELEYGTHGRGIWLACTKCGKVATIKNSGGEPWRSIETKKAALVFKRHGWTGKGDNLMETKCPECNKKGSN